MFKSSFSASTYTTPSSYIIWVHWWRKIHIRVLILYVLFWSCIQIIVVRFWYIVIKAWHGTLLRVMFFMWEFLKLSKIFSSYSITFLCSIDGYSAGLWSGLDWGPNLSESCGNLESSSELLVTGAGSCWVLLACDDTCYCVSICSLISELYSDALICTVSVWEWG